MRTLLLIFGACLIFVLGYVIGNVARGWGIEEKELTFVDYCSCASGIVDFETGKCPACEKPKIMTNM